MAPRLTASSRGVYLSWLEQVGAGRHELKLARFDGESWGETRVLAAGERFFANWADLPAVAEGPDGTLLAHWLAKLGENTYDYGVELTRSQDGGLDWEPLGLLHDDRTLAEHGFVSFVPLEDGVQAFWLDGRAMPSGGDMQLRTTRLLARDGYRPGASTVVDERVCECCSTAAALTAAGPVVAYRDRDADEIRDIAVVRATDGGWSAPRIVGEDGWEIHGCPVNGPAIAARGERVALAWFTGAAGHPRVQIAFSENAGASFGAPLELDAERPLGRLDLELDETGHALVTWLGSESESEGVVRLGRISPEGETRTIESLVLTTTQRSAGVPQAALWEGDLVLAWVEDGDQRRVRVGVLPGESL